MAEKQTVQMPDGSMAEGISLPFEVVNEAWHEYALADGGRVRTRSIAVRIMKMIDSSGEQRHNPDGSLMFMVQTAIASVVHEP